LQCLADNPVITDVSEDASSRISESFREANEFPGTAANAQQGERGAAAGPAPKTVIFVLSVEHCVLIRGGVKSYRSFKYISTFT